MALSKKDYADLLKMQQANMAQSRRVYNPYGGRSMSQFRQDVGWNNPDPATLSPDIGTGADAVYRGRPVRAFTNRADSVLNRSGMDTQLISEPKQPAGPTAYSFVDSPDGTRVKIHDPLNVNPMQVGDEIATRDIPLMLNRMFPGKNYNQLGQLSPPELEHFYAARPAYVARKVKEVTAARANAISRNNSIAKKSQKGKLTEKEKYDIADNYAKMAATGYNEAGEKIVDMGKYDTLFKQRLQQLGGKQSVSGTAPAGTGKTIKTGEAANKEAARLIKSGAMRDKDSAFRLLSTLKRKGQEEVARAILAQMKQSKSGGEKPNPTPASETVLASKANSQERKPSTATKFAPGKFVSDVSGASGKAISDASKVVAGGAGYTLSAANKAAEAMGIGLGNWKALVRQAAKIGGFPLRELYLKPEAEIANLLGMAWKAISSAYSKEGRARAREKFVAAVPTKTTYRGKPVKSQGARKLLSISRRGA